MNISPISSAQATDSVAQLNRAIAKSVTDSINTAEKVMVHAATQREAVKAAEVVSRATGDLLSIIA
jgi:hypothetical protein